MFLLCLATGYPPLKGSSVRCFFIKVYQSDSSVIWFLAFFSPVQRKDLKRITVPLIDFFAKSGSPCSISYCLLYFIYYDIVLCALCVISATYSVVL
jgi:hypothetical protein